MGPGCEAVDQKAGGQFVLWSERENIFYGLNQKPFFPARYVHTARNRPRQPAIVSICTA